MPRFLLGWLLGLGGNAIGLLLAWALLGMVIWAFPGPWRTYRSERVTGKGQ